MYSNEPNEMKLRFNTQYSITRLIYVLLGTKLAKRDNSHLPRIYQAYTKAPCLTFPIKSYKRILYSLRSNSYTKAKFKRFIYACYNG